MKTFARKLCLAALALILAGQDVRAQHPELRFLHVLIVADTLADGIGEGGEKDAATMTSSLLAGIPKERVKITTIKGSQVSRDAILNHYAGLNVGPNDGLLFHYAGHGGLVNQPTREHYLTFGRGKTPNGHISRTELRSAMQAKNPGLVVILTDCCSGAMERLRTPKVKVINPPSRNSTQLEPGYAQLFFRSRGLVDITAADDGELAMGDPLNGGIFTQAFSKAMMAVKTDREVTWATFYPKLKTRTRETFHKIVLDPIEGTSTQTSRAFFLPGGSWGFVLSRKDGVINQISEVHDGSPAQRAGLLRGDIVLKVNCKSVATESECIEAIRASGPELRFTVRTLKNGEQERVLKRNPAS